MLLHDLPIDLAPRTANRVRSLMRLLALLALVAGLAALPWRSAKAADSVCYTGSATSFSMPSTLAVPPGAAVGELLGTTRSFSVRFQCDNIPGGSQGNSLFIQAGDLAPRAATDPGKDYIDFATNVPGIGFRVWGSPYEVKSEACPRCGPWQQPGFEMGRVRSNGRLDQTFYGRFVKTGPVGAGTVTRIDLMSFYWYEYGFTPSSGPMASRLTLNGGTTVSVTGCTVDAGSKNLAVGLPNVRATELATVGATAGRTSFNIRLTCQPGVSAFMTMHTDTPASVKGVVAPTVGAGFAKNVGVQLLNSAQAPVEFDTARTLGSTPSGAWTLTHYAQYYRTATPVDVGAVAATVTFTLTYD